MPGRPSITSMCEDDWKDWVPSNTHEVASADAGGCRTCSNKVMTTVKVSSKFLGGTGPAATYFRDIRGGKEQRIKAKHWLSQCRIL